MHLNRGAYLSWITLSNPLNFYVCIIRPIKAFYPTLSYSKGGLFWIILIFDEKHLSMLKRNNQQTHSFYRDCNIFPKIYVQSSTKVTKQTELSI